MIVPVNHRDLEVLLRFRRLGSKELARRAGLSDGAVIYLLKDKPGGGRTQQIQLSTAVKLSDALGTIFNAATGRFFSRTMQEDFERGVDSDTLVIRSALMCDLRRLVKAFLGTDEKQYRDTFGLLTDLSLWREPGSPRLDVETLGEWSALWTRIAEMSRDFARPELGSILGGHLHEMTQRMSLYFLENALTDPVDDPLSDTTV